ncbi:hypothetical protein FA15DRAFT_671903 [Coprinopsis marcescibilis]|uniref:DUF6533 domain-containing protein n=1 Tax=Coprinopsis marcescibilis TaxID=230819 RepID=A0A5C3KNR9_COPMA|nr:hypothetical protein FA15DRAFT_671903 [Coprinopsis marcescibilis]
MSKTFFNDSYNLDDPRDAIEVLEGTQAVGYSSVASLTFLLYDILITFDDEVEAVWPNRLTLTKMIFFFIRYFPLFLQISTLFIGTPPFTFTARDCYIWNVYQALASLLIISAVDYILVLRVFALYAGNKAVKITTTMLYFAEIITISIGLGLSVPEFTFDEYCTILGSPTTFLISAGAPIAFQTVLFALTGWKFFQAARSGWGNVPIINLLMRDGSWAFMLIFLTLLSEAALYGFAPNAYTDILYGWLNTVFAFCGYRILLNLNTLNRPSSSGRIRMSRGSSGTRTASLVTGAEMIFTSHVHTGYDLGGTTGMMSDGDVDVNFVDADMDDDDVGVGANGEDRLREVEAERRTRNVFRMRDIGSGSGGSGGSGRGSETGSGERAGGEV